LNVFTPLQASSPTPLPVMIFITGGNFQFLDASAPIYESERFVNTTNTVLVFIQYRLGKKSKFYLLSKKTM
jgi:carboxylesterase type B